MAMWTVLTSLPARLRAPSPPASTSATGGLRVLSDGKGHVLIEEERAKESVYIQLKMEREQQEKLKKSLEQKSDADKARLTDADKGNDAEHGLGTHLTLLVALDTDIRSFKFLESEGRSFERLGT